MGTKLEQYIASAPSLLLTSEMRQFLFVLVSFDRRVEEGSSPSSEEYRNSHDPLRRHHPLVRFEGADEGRDEPNESAGSQAHV